MNIGYKNHYILYSPMKNPDAPLFIIKLTHVADADHQRLCSRHIHSVSNHSTMSSSGRNFSLSATSTTAGTRPCTEPPKEATSLTMVEERKENSSEGSINTVSIFISSR